MPSYPPSCFDVADGTIFGIGTPTPPGAIITQNAFGNDFIFEEDPNSPEIERGEQATIVHKFNCDKQTALNIVATIGRGAIFVDSFGNVTRCLTCRYRDNKGNTASIEITAEAISFDVPPDEYSVETIELNPSLFRHPRYNWILNYTPSTGALGGQNLGPQLIAAINSSVDAVVSATQQDGIGLVSNYIVSGDTVIVGGVVFNCLQLANELIGKLRQGNDVFYLAGYKVTWSYYSFLPIGMNPGGYINDPVTQGGLPSYFWSDDGTSSGNNTLIDVAMLAAPQYYSNGLSWLRQADTQLFQRTWFKLTSSWLGAPFGHWDAQIYNGNGVPPVVAT
jgi:hypothetical protein